MKVRTYRAQKAALTRAQKKGASFVLEEVHRAKQEWDSSYWPDDWHRWQRAEDDALMDLKLQTEVGP